MYGNRKYIFCEKNVSKTNRLTFGFASNRKGQMVVEMAVCIPVIIVLAVIAFNVLLYLDTCARFKFVATEAVRVQAISPSYGNYGLRERTKLLQDMIADEFSDRGNACCCKVSISPISERSIDGTLQSTLSLLPGLEVIDFEMDFKPIGFPDGVFQFFAPAFNYHLTLVIDPFKPGVII